MGRGRHRRLLIAFVTLRPLFLDHPPQNVAKKRRLDFLETSFDRLGM